jgi:hypothetical protein
VQLRPLNITLIFGHLNDLRTLDPALLTDAPFQAYVKTLTGYAEKYEKALAQVRANKETEKISQADNLRDKAVAAFAAALKLYAKSDDPAEAEASRGLRILLNNFGDLVRLNYEAETIGIDKLVGELTGPNYAAKVTQLSLERYVARIAKSNEAFKALFGGRMTATALTKTYNLKRLRLEMLGSYKDFCNYVLAMSMAVESPLFTTALSLLNTARKYYADLLARRTAVPQPVTPLPVV